jgi:hypothetical protein
VNQNDKDKVVLSDDNLFWHDPDYRRRLLKEGVDIKKYVRKDGTDCTVERGTFFKYD